MYTLPVPRTCIHTLLKNLYHNSCPFNDRLTLGYKMEQKPSFFLSDWQMSTESKNIGLFSLFAFRNYIICYNW